MTIGSSAWAGAVARSASRSAARLVSWEIVSGNSRRSRRARYCSSAWSFLRIASRCNSASASASVSTAGLPEAIAFRQQARNKLPGLRFGNQAWNRNVRGRSFPACCLTSARESPWPEISSARRTAVSPVITCEINRAFVSNACHIPRLRARCSPQIQPSRDNPPAMPSLAESKKSANLGHP